MLISFHNRQTQTGPLEITLYARSDLEEGIKQAHHFFRRYPHAGIANTDREIIAIRANMQNYTAGIGEFYGVTQQVGDDLL